MAKILLIGSDETYQETLASKLQARGHAVFMPKPRRQWPADWNATMSSVDVVVFDVTLLNDDSKRQLQSICHWSRQDKFPVLVLCYTRVFRGPRFELEIERLGVRFVYAG
jgi:DNA-binding response OmpR family regulator